MNWIQKKEVKDDENLPWIQQQSLENEHEQLHYSDSQTFSENGPQPSDYRSEPQTTKNDFSFMEANYGEFRRSLSELSQKRAEYPGLFGGGRPRSDSGYSSLLSRAENRQPSSLPEVPVIFSDVKRKPHKYKSVTDAEPGVASDGGFDISFPLASMKIAEISHKTKKSFDTLDKTAEDTIEHENNNDHEKTGTDLPDLPGSEQMHHKPKDESGIKEHTEQIDSDVLEKLPLTIKQAFLEALSEYDIKIENKNSIDKKSDNHTSGRFLEVNGEKIPVAFTQSAAKIQSTQTKVMSLEELSKLIQPDLDSAQSPQKQTSVHSNKNEEVHQEDEQTFISEENKIESIEEKDQNKTDESTNDIERIERMSQKLAGKQVGWYESAEEEVDELLDPFASDDTIEDEEDEDMRFWSDVEKDVEAFEKLQVDENETAEYQTQAEISETENETEFSSVKKNDNSEQIDAKDNPTEPNTEPALQQISGFENEDEPEDNSSVLDSADEETLNQEFEDENEQVSPARSSANEKASVTPPIKLKKKYSINSNILNRQTAAQTMADPKETQGVISRLEETLATFGIEGRVVGIQRGPIITRYELKMAPGIKVSRILGLTDELAMALEALRVRIEAPIPGRSTVGIEIPNKSRKPVMLGDILNDPAYKEFEAELPLPLGKDIAGNLVMFDLTKMPHLLIAGATGSGKSVAVNSFITNFIINRSPEQVRFLLIDPKLVELSHYNDIPHLLHPVITEPQKAVLALNWAVEEMERRYEDLAEMRVRDIRSYNEKISQLNENLFRSQNPHQNMPYIVVLIDELGDLMMVAGKEVEASIIRLSQKARAVGIHLILATQRPSVDVITALIKANCPARAALQVAQKTDSRTILDANGAEQLLGQGDLLFRHPARAQLIRLQAPLVVDEEVEAVVEKTQAIATPGYITLDDPRSDMAQLEGEDEELFDEAWQIIVESQKASASYLQRRLRIGYNRAARLIEAFEARGYIGPQIGSKPREILMNNS